MTEMLEIPGLGGDQPPALAGPPAPALFPEAGAGIPLTIVVRDTPRPQGSKDAFRNPHTGRIQQVESSKSVTSWRESVRSEAVAARLLEAHVTIDGPVSVDVTFTAARPKGHYRTGRYAHLLRDAAPGYPAVRPDLDKTLRSTLDALKAAGVYTDDARVVEIRARKVYPETHQFALDTPGAVIHVRALQETTHDS